MNIEEQTNGPKKSSELCAVPKNLIAFTQLYRMPTDVMAQQDQLDVRGPSLKLGDVFMQAHEFIKVPRPTRPDSFWIAAGLYRTDSDERWPISINDQRYADRILSTRVRAMP